MRLAATGARSLFRTPDDPPSPEEADVIFWGVIVLSLVASAVAFYLAHQAPANKPESALQLRQIGAICLLVAVFIYGTKRAIDFFID